MRSRSSVDGVFSAQKLPVAMDGAEVKAEVISDDELMSAVVGIISEHKR
jgi:hypothetical protein